MIVTVNIAGQYPWVSRTGNAFILRCEDKNMDNVVTIILDRNQIAALAREATSLKED